MIEGLAEVIIAMKDKMTLTELILVFGILALWRDILLPLRTMIRVLTKKIDAGCYDTNGIESQLSHIHHVLTPKKPAS